jgi:hypothetical protein
MSARPPQELIARHEEFLACAPTDRPLLGYWMGGYFPAEQFPRGTSGLPQEGQALSPGDVRLEDFAEDYERLYRIHRDADDDFFYVGSAYWGIPWLEAILGCKVVAGKTTCWSEACIETLLCDPALRSPLRRAKRRTRFAGRSRGLDALSDAGAQLDGNEWFRCLERFTRELVELSAGRFPVCVPLLRGPLDAAGAMRGMMDLVMEYVDEPAGVKRLLGHCVEVRLEITRRLNRIIPAWHGTYAAGGYPSKVWSRRTVGYNQDDSAALLSPGLFREFLLPVQRRMCAAAQVNFFHLHSGCLWPAELLLQEDCYDVLEVNIDHPGAGPTLAEILPTLKKIQAAHKPLLLWGEIGAQERELISRELSPAGLSIQPICSTPA